MVNFLDQAGGFSKEKWQDRVDVVVLNLLQNSISYD